MLAGVPTCWRRSAGRDRSGPCQEQVSALVKHIETAPRTAGKFRPAVRGTVSVRGRGTDRILDVLDHLEKVSPVTVKDLASALKAPKSTLYLLVELLVAREYLEAASDGHYQLGPRAGRLGMAYGRTNSFPAVARQLLQELADASGVVAELVVLENWMQFVAFAMTSADNPYLRSSEGARFPLPHTASARFLLRDVPPNTILREIPAEHYRFPNGDSITPQAFIDDIAASRDALACSTRGIVAPHLSCIAAPLLGPDGKCRAAVSLVMPLAEIDAHEAVLTQTVLRTAAALSEQMRMIPVNIPGD